MKGKLLPANCQNSRQNIHQEKKSGINIKFMEWHFLNTMFWEVSKQSCFFFPLNNKLRFVCTKGRFYCLLIYFCVARDGNMILQWKQIKVWFMVTPPKRVFPFVALCMTEKTTYTTPSYTLKSHWTSGCLSPAQFVHYSCLNAEFQNFLHSISSAYLFVHFLSTSFWSFVKLNKPLLCFNI